MQRESQPLKTGRRRNDRLGRGEGHLENAPADGLYLQHGQLDDHQHMVTPGMNLWDWERGRSGSRSRILAPDGTLNLIRHLPAEGRWVARPCSADQRRAPSTRCGRSDRCGPAHSPIQVREIDYDEALALSARDDFTVDPGRMIAVM